MAQDPCSDSPALIGFGNDSADAPTLNYSMPVSTEFSMFGTVRYAFPQGYFVQNPIPRNLPGIDQVKSDILYALAAGISSQFIDADPEVLQQVIFMMKEGNTVKQVKVTNLLQQKNPPSTN